MIKSFITYLKRAIAQRRAVALINSLTDYDFSNYTLESFTAYAEGLKRREFLLKSLPDFPVFGAWITSLDKEREYIFLDKGMNNSQREVTILHEIGHILFNHPTGAIRHDEKFLDNLYTCLENSLCRSNGMSFIDMEAESFALEILRRRDAKIQKEESPSERLGF